MFERKNQTLNELADELSAEGLSISAEQVLATAAEIESLKTVPPEKRQDLYCVIADITRQCQEALADAERYRWFRDNQAHDSLPFFTDQGLWVVQSFPAGGGIHERNYKTLDAAIDAARRAQGGE